MSSSKLPPRKGDVVKSVHDNPVWTLSSATPASNGGGNATSPAAEPPLNSMCDQHARPDAVCCRTLKGEDERSLINPDIVKDIIIGLSDGLTVPFGLTAGLAAVGNAKLVVIGGISELISGSISMGVGGYLSAQAEQDHYHYLLRTTRQRVKRSCAGEIEREVTDVLSSVGLDQSTCRRVAHGLMKVEAEVLDELDENSPYKVEDVSFFQSILRTIARKPKGLLNGDSESYGTFDSNTNKNLKSAEEFGLTAFLIKFAEGQEEVPNSRLIISALTIGLSYAVGGIIPLIPYFFFDDIMSSLYLSIIVTGLTLIVFGIAKAYYTGSKIGWKGYTKSALSTLAIGGLAAGSAYGISKALEGSM